MHTPLIEGLRPKQKKARLRTLLILACIASLIWHNILTISRSRHFIISFLKVGQGDGILIESPVGNQMLIDGGPDRSVMTALGKEMSWFDRHIDVVVNTHPDLDHIGGLPAVMEKYSVDAFIDPGLRVGSSAQKSLFDLIRQKDVKHIVAKRNQVIDLGGGVFIHILFPDRDVSSWKKTNNTSIFTKVIYGKSSFLLSGDAPSAIEEYVVSVEGEELYSTVLKAGHHGSKTSTAQKLLNATAPQVVVISFGKKNRYGHPNIEVTERIQEKHIPILTTETATLRLCSNGETVWKC